MWVYRLFQTYSCSHISSLLVSILANFMQSILYCVQRTNAGIMANFFINKPLYYKSCSLLIVPFIVQFDASLLLLSGMCMGL